MKLNLPAFVLVAPATIHAIIACKYFKPGIHVTNKHPGLVQSCKYAKF